MINIVIKVFDIHLTQKILSAHSGDLF